MKILLIDNNTIHLEAWEKLGRRHGFELKIIRYHRVNSKNSKNFDLIVLSGGTHMAIPKNREKLVKEVKLIKTTNTPIVGICLGFELIADTFGAKLLYRKNRRRGIEDIKIVKNDEIFGRMKSFKANVAHKYYVRALPKNLVALAKSESGIEVFKHRSRPIYAFQFHPEIISKENGGTKIFLNLLKLIKKLINPRPRRVS